MIDNFYEILNSYNIKVCPSFVEDEATDIPLWDIEIYKEGKDRPIQEINTFYSSLLYTKEEIEENPILKKKVLNFIIEDSL